MRRSLLLLITLVLFIYPGCSYGDEYLSKNKKIAPASMGGVQMVAERKAALEESFKMDDMAEPSPAKPIDRKVIYTANINIEVKSCDKSLDKIKSIVGEYKGLIADSSVTEHSEGRKTARIVVRVPASEMDAAMTKLKELGKVKSQRVYGDDITEEYVDLQARLKNAKRMEKRLVDLLEKKAQKLKDMLEVEKELGRVRENIERMEGRKRYFDQHVAMSTITIDLFEPYKYTSSVFDPIKEALEGAGKLFMESLGGVVLFIAAGVPWFILIGLFVYLIVVLIKRAIRKKKGIAKSKREEKDVVHINE